MQASKQAIAVARYPGRGAFFSCTRIVVSELTTSNESQIGQMYTEGFTAISTFSWKDGGQLQFPGWEYFLRGGGGETR